MYKAVSVDLNKWQHQVKKNRSFYYAFFSAKEGCVYVCADCGFKHKAKTEMVRHQDIQHFSQEVAKSFACCWTAEGHNPCSWTSRSSSTAGLRQHVIRSHIQPITSDIRYVCCICDRKHLDIDHVKLCTNLHEGFLDCDFSGHTPNFPSPMRTAASSCQAYRPTLYTRPAPMSGPQNASSTSFPQALDSSLPSQGAMPAYYPPFQHAPGMRGLQTFLAADDPFLPISQSASNLAQTLLACPVSAPAPPPPVTQITLLPQASKFNLCGRCPVERGTAQEVNSAKRPAAQTGVPEPKAQTTSAWFAPQALASDPE